MHTAAGLRFLRTLAMRGERVPAYLLPNDTAPRGAAQQHQCPTRPVETAQSRVMPR